MASEEQLELLETYLDGELPEAQAAAMTARLDREPDLAKLLDSLRDERQLRAMVWQAYEPGTRTVERLLQRVERKVDNHWWWASQVGNLRWIGAVAACLLFGWVGRGLVQPPPANPRVPSFVQVGANQPRRGPVSMPIYDGEGRLVAVQSFQSAEEARQFISDLQRLQSMPGQSAPGGNIVPVAEKF